MKPKISFAITTNNEGEYIKRLFSQLIPFCRDNRAEIVVLDDQRLGQKWSLETAQAFGMLDGTFASTMTRRKMDGDFAKHKNYLNSLCKGEYIFQIDADETLHPDLLKLLPSLLEMNYDVDLFLVPRINTVEGLTEEDIRRWNWRVNEQGWVMFPDYQSRLYKNRPEIKWEGKVHERIVGHKTMTPLPAMEEWCIIHSKDIDRQRKQNQFYEQL